jgi:hypothetical protein
MFELLDDDTRSPDRMPSSPLYRYDSSVALDDLLALLAFGGLILGERLGMLHVARLAVWLAAGGAGWWLVYRHVRRVEALWDRDPPRRTRLVVKNALALLVLLTLVFSLAIKSEGVVQACYVLAIVMFAVEYLRQRRREST